MNGNGIAPTTATAVLSQPNIDAMFLYNYADYSGRTARAYRTRISYLLAHVCARFVLTVLWWCPAGLHGEISWAAGKPVIGGRFNLWGNGSDPSGPTFCNVSQLAAALLAQPRDPTSAAGYSLVPLHAWSHTVSDALAVVEAVAAAGADAGVRFVTPDVFVDAIVANVPH